MTFRNKFFLWGGLAIAGYLIWKGRSSIGTQNLPMLAATSTNIQPLPNVQPAGYAGAGATAGLAFTPNGQ